MYPFIRYAKEMRKARRAPALGLLEPHFSRHICWPQDLDPWWELNNGRTLTMLDLGRVPLTVRVGVRRVTFANGWRMTVAGSSLRYRRRVPGLARIDMRSRIVGWDHRFFYIEQSMWLPDGECANQALFRIAVTDGNGIIAPERVTVELGHPKSPELPVWVSAWIAADGQREWPPER